MERIEIVREREFEVFFFVSEKMKGIIIIRNKMIIINKISLIF